MLRVFAGSDREMRTPLGLRKAKPASVSQRSQFRLLLCHRYFPLGRCRVSLAPDANEKVRMEGHRLFRRPALVDKPLDPRPQAPKSLGTSRIQLAAGGFPNLVEGFVHGHAGPI